MSNTYKSLKKGRQVDSAIDYIEKLPQKLTDIELSIKETNNNKADKVSIPRNLGDLIDDITQQNYDANSSSPQSGKAVAEAINQLLGSAPEALDTLNELAEALGNDPNFATTVLTEIGKKADKNLGFDYYYELNTAIENYNNFTAPGLYKIRHVTSSIDRTNILLVTKLTSIRACLQFKIANSANIYKRQGNLLEDGTVENWGEWVAYATTSYVDEKISELGNIETSSNGFDYNVYGQYMIDSEGDMGSGYYLKLLVNEDEFGNYYYYEEIFDDLTDNGVYKIHIDNRELLMDGYPKYETSILIVGETDWGGISQTIIDCYGDVRYRTTTDNITEWNPWEYDIIPIDSSLSLTSTNPVQNKVVKAELDKKATTDYVDEKIGNIDTLLDSILAIEQELIGEALVDTSIAVCDSYINGGNAE